MKLGTIKRISRDDLVKSGGEIPKWVDAFLDPLNQFIEKVGLALSNGLTLEDNFLTKKVKISFTHGVEQRINPFPVGSRNLSVVGVVPVSYGNESLDKFKWIHNSDGTISVTFQFDGGTSSTSAICTLFIFLG